MTLHNFCLDLLNHELTQALACGKRLHSGNSKNLILLFGSLHLFVVSGAHLNFIKKMLNLFHCPSKLKHIFLSLFLAACNFSAPILRTYIQSILISQKIFKLPSQVAIVISYLFCFPIALIRTESLSLGLSFLFGAVVSLLPHKWWAYLLVYILALPVFLNVLGIPHYSSLIALPLLSVFISLLLPLSLLSLLSNTVEYLSIKIWWHLKSILNFVEVFYNYPHKPSLNIDTYTSLNLFFYGGTLLLLTYFIGILWQRSSYSFS